MKHTVVAAALLTRYAHEPAMAFTVIMLAGAFQMGFGLMRLGRYINLMPHPVISGFMSGIGCIIITLYMDTRFRLGTMLGVRSPYRGRSEGP